MYDEHHSRRLAPFSSSRARQVFPSCGFRHASHHVDADAVLDVLGAGVITVRAGGRVSSANPQAARILRRSVAELEGRLLQDFVAPVDELLASAGAQANAGREGSRGELTIRVADGELVALGFSLSTLHDMLGREHHVLLFQDISSVLELRKARDRLLQMAVLGDVMPTLLHEMRNPLAAATAMLEVLIEDAEPELKADLHTILCEVRRMALGLQELGGR
jgi:nitrogen fixation/metabolism regulation signal transduction histidine kinase